MVTGGYCCQLKFTIGSSQKCVENSSLSIRGTKLHNSVTNILGFLEEPAKFVPNLGVTIEFVVFCDLCTLILMLVAAWSYETLVYNHHTSRCNNPENLKFREILIS
jgi:hypothetical protein